MKILSVICARAGSKGLKNKCVYPICGKMVVEYAIEYSLMLGPDVVTVVSTDIKELIEHCRRNNINCIERDKELCTDESSIEGALADAIEKAGQDADYCSLVHGNVPIRYPALFHAAFRFLKDYADYDAAITMQNVEKYHPDWMFDYGEGSLPHMPGIHYNRQMLKQKMIADGHTFIFKAWPFYERWKGLKPCDKYLYSMFGSKIKPIVNDKVIVDIDCERDLRIAEALISYSKENCPTNAGGAL